jgi:hypothetical protein
MFGHCGEINKWLQRRDLEVMRRDVAVLPDVAKEMMSAAPYNTR